MDSIGGMGTHFTYNGLDARTAAVKQNSHEEYRYNSRGQMVEVLSYAIQNATTAVNGNFWVTRS